MALIKLDTLEYPVSIAEFAQRHPQMMLPAIPVWEDFGYANVFPAPAPVPANPILQRAQEIVPHYVSGHWEQDWKIVDIYSNIPEGATKEEQETAAISAATVAASAATLSTFTNAVQAHLDTAAASKGYDNIVSACSYAGAANPFQAEGIAYVIWRGAVWTYCYGELAKVQNGTRALPALSDFLNELPVAP